MSIRRLSIMSVPVSDQQAARDFYVDVLGFEVVRDNPMGPEARWIQLRPVGGEASITLVTWFERMQPGAITGMVLETDDIDSTHADLSARGVVLSEISEAPWGRWAMFEDPDGNGWVLQQSAGGF